MRSKLCVSCANVRLHEATRKAAVARGRRINPSSRQRSGIWEIAILDGIGGPVGQRADGIGGVVAKVLRKYPCPARHKHVLNVPALTIAVEHAVYRIGAHYGPPGIVRGLIEIQRVKS